MSQLRLDNTDTAFLKRELESIDSQTYEIKFPSLRARELFPSQGGIPDWALEYTWRMMTKEGSAKFIGRNSDDLPRVNLSKDETTRFIKDIGTSFAYSIREVKAANAMGLSLDAEKARIARYFIEEKLDEILALGDSDHNLNGFLKLDLLASDPVGVDASAGNWSGLTAAQIATEIFDTVNAREEAINEAPIPSQFDILLPISQYNLISQTRFSVDNPQTILGHVLEKSDNIRSVRKWRRLSGAAANDTDDRMMVYSNEREVLAGIVTNDYEQVPDGWRNFEYVVNAMASTGGAVCRYPVAIRYVDGI